MAILSPTTKTATVRSTFGRSPLTVHYGGDYIDPGEILLDEPRHGHYDGVALRDALLEAFPLDEPTLSGAAKADVVPGMMLSSYGGEPYVILPDGRYWDTLLNRAYPYVDVAWHKLYDLVFDPRGAKALPNPLGIRVGDRVERTKNGITVAFEVGHIDGTTKFLYAKGDDPKFPVSYNPKEFTVTSREVPDRLPAGTIVRDTDLGERLYLITSDTALPLHATWRDRDGSDFAGLVKKGRFEVIYLP